MSSHPRLDLDPAFGNPLRFSLVAALSGVDYMVFKDLRDYIATTDSTLSKHASALEELGYVKIKKGFVGKKPQTKLSLTSAGLKAWKAHLVALREIAG
ncbi:transcriptional regulator [Corynebacterium sp. H128]|uniref:winged helix-turn-helix domain-containing protein n=1 Tax=unclassified Corynebacterium TaxID=2624378 RepID=UPI0030ADAB8F